MSRKGKNYYDNYDYLTEETIQRASEGDSKALSDVILRYMNYGRKCFRTLAATKYGRDPETLPMEDLMQMVWMRFAEIIVKKFTVDK